MDKQRLTKIQKLLEREKIDCLLIFSSNSESRFSKWLYSSAPTSSEYIIIQKKSCTLLKIEYFIETEDFKPSLKVIPIEDESNFNRAIYNLTKSSKVIGVCGPAPFTDLLPVKDKIVDISNKVEYLIRTKNLFEIKEIRRSANVLKKTFKLIGKYLKIGINEENLSKKIKQQLLKDGDQLAFPVSIASEERLKMSTVGKASNEIIQGNYSVCIDIGIVKNGFYSDATRMFFIGNRIQEEKYRKLKKIQRQVISKLKAGISLREVKNLYTQEFKMGELQISQFVENDLGHGIGFGLHEKPSFYSTMNQKQRLSENMVITLEPEIVVDGYRYRIENMVVIRKTKAEILI